MSSQKDGVAIFFAFFRHKFRTTIACYAKMSYLCIVIQKNTQGTK